MRVITVQPSTTKPLLALANATNFKQEQEARRQAKQNNKEFEVLESAPVISAQSTNHTNSYVELSTSSEVLATISNRLSA
jgi:hypothetical protein